MPLSIRANGEDFEYWEESGHIVVRSMGASSLVTEVPRDSVCNSQGYIIPKLISNYLKENYLKKPLRT